MRLLLCLILLLFVNNVFSDLIQESSNNNQNSIKLSIYGDKLYNNDLNKSEKRKVKAKNGDTRYISLDKDTTVLYTDITVGGVNQKVVIDTGSTLLIVPSVYCNNCEQQIDYYAPSPFVDFIECNEECATIGNECIDLPNGGNGASNVCGYRQVFLQGTEMFSLFVTDTFSFTNKTDEILTTFGALVDVEGAPLSNGILGLGKMCQGCRRSPIETILDTLNVPRIFSFSFDKDYHGTLILGNVDNEYANSIVYSPMLTIDGTHYSVGINKFTMVDDKNNKLELRGKDFGDFIFDSGSTDTYLSAFAFKRIREFLQKGCRPGMCSPFGGSDTFVDGTCYDYPIEYFKTLPKLHFEMVNGAIMEVDPMNYITETIRNGKKFYCFSIRQSPIYGRSIIGLTWFRDQLISFDNENDRIGFAKRN